MPPPPEPLPEEPEETGQPAVPTKHGVNRVAEPAAEEPDDAVSGISDAEWQATERAAAIVPAPGRPKTPAKAVRQRGEAVEQPPARQESRNGTQPGAERVAPHNIDAEQGLLASCLIDETGVILADCVKAGMTGQHFYRPQHDRIFGAMLALRKDGAAVDEITVANWLKEAKQLDACGGHSYLYELMNRIQTTVGARDWREIVVEKYHLRCLIRKSQWLVEQAHSAGPGSVSELVECAKAEFAHIERAIFADPEPPRSLMDFQLQEHNPNRLLGDDYIERGDVFTVISETSAGKSSFIIQFAVCLALGRTFFGIQTAGKWRSLIIQAEDSDSYNAKVKESVSQGLSLTQEEQAEVGGMVKIKRLRGLSGPAFYAKVRILAEAHHADFVWINPIGRFINGSLAKDEIASEMFLQLDVCNPNSQWAYGIVEHTGKPAKDDGKPDNNKAIRSAYKGFGSSVLANSPRAIMVIEQRTDIQEGREFWLDLPKNGLRAGVTERVEQGIGAVYKPIARVALKHTARFIKTPWGKELPMYLWEASEQTQAPTPERTAKMGAPKKEDDDRALSFFPITLERAFAAGAIQRLIMENLMVGESTAKQIMRRLRDAGKITMAANNGYYQTPPF